MIDICMYGCRSCNFNCKYCFGPNENQNSKFVLDREKVLDAINKISNKKNCSSNCFMIWGGEPLLHVKEFKETLSFLQENFPTAKIQFSTNGFLLQKKEVRDFIIKNNLYMQLSVDGIAQSVRSNYNPLEDSEVSKFLAKRALDNKVCFNCVMSIEACQPLKMVDIPALSRL